MEILHALMPGPSLPALFLLSFLASTILPIGSEWLVVVMVIRGFPVSEVVATATFGNILGACTTYYLGIWGSEYLIRTIFRISDNEIAKARKIYDKYGTWSLLLSWLPVVGDPLCLVAGIFKTGFFRFCVLVFIGKFARYATLALLVQQGIGE